MESDGPIRGGRRVSVQIEASRSAHAFQDPCTPRADAGILLKSSVSAKSNEAKWFVPVPSSPRTLP